MSAIILRDEIVHYEVLGRGRPLVFLHGWVGSWRYWIPTMQPISISFRAYALDLWGFGDSAKNPENYSLERQLDLIDNFLNELGIGKIALIGHGLGAILGLLYAKRRPGSVDRVMAVSYPFSFERVNPRLRTAPPLEVADWLFGRAAGAEPVLMEVPKMDPRAITLAMSSLQSMDLAELPGALECACLLVHGVNDMAVAAPDPELTTTLPEHAHLITLEGSGHFPMLDEKSKFNRLLSDMLSLNSGESPRQLQLKDEWKRRVR